MILFTSLLPKIVILEFTSSREGKTPFTIIFSTFYSTKPGVQRNRIYAVFSHIIQGLLRFPLMAPLVVRNLLLMEADN